MVTAHGGGVGVDANSMHDVTHYSVCTYSVNVREYTLCKASKARYAHRETPEGHRQAPKQGWGCNCNLTPRKFSQFLIKKEGYNG